MKRYRRQCTG